MIYIPVKNKLKSLKEIAAEYNVPTRLIYTRYRRGIKDIKELTQSKHDMVRK
jgi:hypothetical protein